MKTPRVKDFDPNPKEIPVLKSSLDNMPVIQRPKPLEVESKNNPVPPVRVVPLVRDAPYDTPRTPRTSRTELCKTKILCFDNYINRYRNENYYHERRADTAAGIFLR